MLFAVICHRFVKQIKLLFKHVQFVPACLVGFQQIINVIIACCNSAVYLIFQNAAYVVRLAHGQVSGGHKHAHSAEQSFRQFASRHLRAAFYARKRGHGAQVKRKFFLRDIQPLTVFSDDVPDAVDFHRNSIAQKMAQQTKTPSFFLTYSYIKRNISI